MFRCHLLGLLKGGSYHGYALAKEYRRRSGAQVAFGQVYRELRGLVEQGYAERVQAAPDEDSRRTPYRITDRGVVAFDDWFREVPEGAPYNESELAVRVMFFAEVELAEASQVLGRWKFGLWQLSKELEIELECALEDALGEISPRVLLINRRMGHVSAELQFIENVQRTFDLPETRPRELERDWPSFATRGSDGK